MVDVFAPVLVAAPSDLIIKIAGGAATGTISFGALTSRV